jgi:3D (Asp-Asp-Asp) domain-containing protein
MSFKRIKRLIRNQKRKAVIGLALAGFMSVSAGFTSQNLHDVRILVDGRAIETQTTQLSPEQIFLTAGVDLGQRDEFLLRNINGQTEIIVYRAVPVTVEYDGEVTEFVTCKPTVEEALINLGYNLVNYDVEPGLSTSVTPNLHITLSPSEAALEREALLAETAEMSGDRSTQRELDALRRELYGEVAEEYAEESYQEEISRGAGRYAEAIVMEATAYLPTDGGGSGITACGIPAAYGVVAVDPDVIPLGTRLYIPGYGEAIAADTGGAIVGNKIDLCMESYGDCMTFGRRDVLVYVLY